MSVAADMQTAASELARMAAEQQKLIAQFKYESNGYGGGIDTGLGSGKSWVVPPHAQTSARAPRVHEGVSTV